MAHPAAATPPAQSSVGLQRSFDGVSSHDSRDTNFNSEFEPPDQGLCVGDGFILEAVNSAYSIYRTNGTRVRGPFNVNDLFNEGSTEFTSDPRCYFEPATHTWYAVILFIDFATGQTRADLAVNTSGDPTSIWTQYRLDTTDDGRLGEPRNPGCPCLGDQPLLGIDQNNVYLSTNEFSVNGPEFNGAQIYAVAKADLLAGRPAAHIVHFGDLSVDGALAASVQPATTSGAEPAEYFLSSLDPNGTFDSRLGVWAITGGAKVAAGGMPTLSSVVISSQAYGVPPPAAQRGSASNIDSGDDRMQQAQFTGGRLWGALTTAVTIPGDTAERAGAAWFSVVPTLRGGVVAAAHIDRQGYVVKSGAYILYPALQADAFGRAAMTFTLTGPPTFPSAAYATLGAGAANFRAPTVAAAGTGPYDKKATRWGDYSYASINRSGTAVWLATEYVPPPRSQTPDRRRNWGTLVFSVGLN
ncbi:hypothetical protein [Lapillicoccus sp.]|uniref:hypothetical protein n=1 Tax=Lapillicoccus sp. TaxID=1909287 RepID=UPI0025DE02FE|nr:hypothetical protein [Lapillicoccus sp.]